VASSAPNSAPQKWRRPVKQRSRLVRRTGPPHARVEFAHHSEQEFARFLDYYRIRWIYEPMSFPIAWEGTRVSEMFTPDFYLPEQDMYVELTTMKQSLVTPKNRKLRMLKELYPELNVRLLYRKDYQQLLAKAGYGVLEVQNLRRQDIGEILISPVELETRVRALGRKISRDYRGESLVVVGVLKGITFFLADLARQITVPFVIDYLDLRRYAGAQPKDRVRIARDELRRLRELTDTIKSLEREITQLVGDIAGRRGDVGGLPVQGCRHLVCHPADARVEVGLMIPSSRPR